MEIMSFRRAFFIAVSAVFLLFSCSSGENASLSTEQKIDLKNSFWYLPCDEKSDVADAENRRAEFLHLDDTEPCNLMRIAGKKGSYLWLRADFEIPENLKKKDLALYISYLRFASKVWINGNYAGSYGDFPPEERSALFVSHFYPFSRAALNETGQNTVLIKVWAHGKSSLSDVVYVSEWENALSKSQNTTFNHAKVYMLFVGGMLVSFSLYFFLYLSRREDKDYLPFSMICLFTMIFLSVFFAPEVPWYNAVPYLLFIKITLCCSFYALLWFITSFVLGYLGVPPSKKRTVARYTLLLVPAVLTIFAPSYNFLMAICPAALLMSIGDLSFALYAFFRALFDPARRRNAIVLISGFAPVLFFIAIDLFVRNVLHYTDYPYFAIFGLQLSLTIFIFILSMIYSRISKQNEHLTAELEKEVEAN